jgi:hypothetical protein
LDDGRRATAPRYRNSASDHEPIESSFATVKLGTLRHHGAEHPTTTEE